MKRNALSVSLAASTLLAMPAIIHNEAYANTLTGIIPDLYAGMDVISRELVGFLPIATRNPTAERAAVGQSVVYPISPAMQAYDIVPAMNTPEPPDVVIGNGSMTITKSKGVPFGFTGEEQRALNTGPGYTSVQAGLFAEGLRVLVNEMERDLAIEAAVNASRAVGTAGVTPFETNLKELALLRKVLDDNGAPLTGRGAVFDTSAGANMRSVSNLSHVNEAGTSLTLRQGQLLDIYGFSIHESAAVPQWIAGTGDDATTNAAGYAVGATVITLAAAGTGTIKRGDVVTFAGDTNKYVVAAGDDSVANGGAITLANPGLRVAIPASATAVTVIGDATHNVAFSADALHIAMRAPALPQEGDLAIDRMLITDPRSGMVFEISVYPGYRKVRLEVAAAWGVKATKSNHIALMLG